MDTLLHILAAAAFPSRPDDLALARRQLWGVPEWYAFGLH